MLDNTFIDTNKIKIKGPSKKYITYTIYAVAKSNINKLNKLYKGLQRNPYNFDIFICMLIKLYKLMNIKNYKRILKYNFILSYPIQDITYNQILADRKLFNKVYDVIKQHNQFKLLDKKIKECKKNMK